jgi:hypothetical protein
MEEGEVMERVMERGTRLSHDEGSKRWEDIREKAGGRNRELKIE